MRAIILSAGKSSRFFGDMPDYLRPPHKSLCPMGGDKCILWRQKNALASVGCHDITVVYSGDNLYWKHWLDNMHLSENITLIENHDAERFGSYKSIYAGISRFDEDDGTIILEGDIWIDNIAFFVEDFKMMLNYPYKLQVLAYRNPISKTGVYLTQNPFNHHPSYYYDLEHKGNVPINSVESCQIWYIPKQMWTSFRLSQQGKDLNGINWQAFNDLPINIVQASRRNYLNINSKGDLDVIRKCLNSR